MGRARRSLVQKLLRAADSQFFELPKGWHIFTRYRTAELFLKHPGPAAVTYTDANLYRELIKKYPEVKLQPIRINSSQPSLASSFVSQQEQSIKQQLAARQQEQEQQQQLGQQALQHQQRQQQQLQPTRADVDTAFRKAESRMGRQLQEAGRETSAGGYLEFIQEQEEEALQAALKKLSSQEAAMSKS